ncbi:MAG: lysine transporter LysE [Alcanivoracaceae bacterium]|uniref:LysE family translocator n=1 Tax=Alcanivorax sp. MD8A TaxID=1177157 RepID=UPI000C69C31E|nr:LysE family translocator [Alcanivorax sp. MD8A]MAX56172.1 lysine transporter LysE [Alcanivoracaceae bacterium]PNE02779.1 amino acid transporter LysE [Alcanivorax sp. MD8A]|tara:strand:+ start:77 stop:730 length:654 start_codon:yes stop_codon:yes gene_type:complete
MLPLHDWLLLASICALGAMTPGISLAVITRHTLHGGARAGAIAGLTHALGVGIWAAATVAGMAVLFKRYPGLELAFSLLGALFLLWMAWKSWQASRQSQAPAHTSPPSNVIHGAAWDGFAVAFLNPKVALFFLALFSQFLSSEMGQPARIQIALTAMIIDGGWYVLVALLLGRSRFLPWLREHHHWVERGTAVLLVVIACSVVTQTLWLDPPALTWG